MDKRYQVFVSSTYQDLQEERQEVMHALLELDCIPSGMELFPATSDDQWSLIKRVINDSDYYILILGGRYGSIGKDGISYTEMEYRYALKTKKPIISFLHKNPGDISSNKSEQTPDGKKSLEEFRKLVQNKMCKYWTTPAELGSVVSRSLIQLIKHYPATGWIKADTANNTELASEIVNLRKKIKELENENKKLNPFSQDRKDSKFLEECLSGITSNMYNIYSVWLRKEVSDTETIQWLKNLEQVLDKYKWSEYVLAEDLFSNIEIAVASRMKKIPKRYVLNLFNVYKTIDTNDSGKFVYAVMSRINSVLYDDDDDLPF